MAYNVRKMARVEKDYQAGSKGAKAMGAEMRKIFDDDNGDKNGNGTGGGTGGTGGGGGQKAPGGGTKFGKFLRTIGSKFTKDQSAKETTDVESGQTTTGGADPTITTENDASNVKPNGDTNGEKSDEVQLYSSMNAKDKAAAMQYNMQQYGTHNPSKDAKLAGVSKAELAKRYAATQKSTSDIEE